MVLSQNLPVRRSLSSGWGLNEDFALVRAGLNEVFALMCGMVAKPARTAIALIWVGAGLNEGFALMYGMVAKPARTVGIDLHNPRARRYRPF
jgi:hypothetical protein